MRAICTNNEKHKEFTVTAHVTQDWKVDEGGNFIECTNPCVEQTHRPDKDDVWTCAICGAEAEVID